MWQLYVKKPSPVVLDSKAKVKFLKSNSKFKVTRIKTFERIKWQRRKYEICELSKPNISCLNGSGNI
jgi:hypothetical protein